jgi:ABC-type Na+ transport system ATPase subunit NatA
MNEQIIALNGLTKSYGKHRGISDLTFSVNAGEIFGFIGPNGAGKSTTIRTLMGLIRPTGGSAAIFGLDCQTQASEIAKNVGYLPSEDSYYENMKVHQLLQYTADLYGMDCWSRVNDLAARLDLDIYRRISDLSLGNRKKVGIVSALITRPKLVIMDEPTSGLDPLIQQAFYELLEEENRRGKLDTRKTVLDLFFGNGVALAMPFLRFVSRSAGTRGVFPQGHRICQSAVPCVRLKCPAYGRKLLSPCHSVRRVSVRPCRDTHAPC